MNIWKNQYLLLTIVMVLVTILFTIIDIPLTRPTEDFIRFLDKKIPLYMSKYDVGAVSVGLIHNGEVAYLNGYGYSDEEKTIPVTADTIFQSGSISKAVTACGIMKLVDDDVISLDAPVSSYLKNWKLPQSDFDENGVTVRRLLSHTAGIANVGGGYSGFLPGEAPQTLVESLVSARDANDEAVRLIAEPGTEHIYSGGGYTILQLLIEDVTGLSFNNFMKNEVLTPANMKDSSFVLTPEIEKNMSVVFNLSKETASSRIFTAKAAAGLYTNAKDLSEWVTALMKSRDNEGFLKQDTIREMFLPQEGTSRFFPNGLSFSLSKMHFKSINEIYHSGINLPGWCAIVTMLPSQKDGLVIMTNYYGGTALIHKIRSFWLIWETGSCGNNPLRLQKAVNILKVVLPVGLCGYIFLIVSSIRKRSRK